MSTRWSADPVVTGLLALSLAGNVWLGGQVRRLRAFEPPAPTLVPGARWPALALLDAKRQPVTVSAAGQSQPTVFYVFSPTCAWCERNTEAVAALARAAGHAYRFVGVCIGAHAACVAARAWPPFPAYTAPTTGPLDALGLTAVPQTIVVTPAGQVTRVFQGAYVGPARDEVERFFATTLPQP